MELPGGGRSRNPCRRDGGSRGRRPAGGPRAPDPRLGADAGVRGRRRGASRPPPISHSADGRTWPASMSVTASPASSTRARRGRAPSRTHATGRAGSISTPFAAPTGPEGPRRRRGLDALGLGRRAGHARDGVHGLRISWPSWECVPEAVGCREVVPRGSGSRRGAGHAPPPQEGREPQDGPARASLGRGLRGAMGRTSSRSGTSPSSPREPAGGSMHGAAVGGHRTLADPARGRLGAPSTSSESLNQGQTRRIPLGPPQKHTPGHRRRPLTHRGGGDVHHAWFRDLRSRPNEVPSVWTRDASCVRRRPSWSALFRCMMGDRTGDAS